MASCAYHTIVFILGAHYAQRIQGQQFQSQSPYSYPQQQVQAAQNLRLQQVQQMQQPMQQRPSQQDQQFRIQQQRAKQNDDLWREAEEEEQRDEMKEQQAAMQQKKMQQLMQLQQQEQAHPAPPPETKGMWTDIQAAMQGVTLQVLYNIVLFAIAGSAVAFSLRTHVASALKQVSSAAKAKASSSGSPEMMKDEASSELPKVEEDPKTAVALSEAQDTLALKPAAPTAAKDSANAAYLPRALAEPSAPSSKESKPVYLCEATFHKYDGMDALQKALKTHSQRVDQGDGNCILIAGNPGKDVASCAQQ